MVGVKDEKSFYDKYPNTPQGEKAFLAKYGKQLKKLQGGDTLEPLQPKMPLIPLPDSLNKLAPMEGHLAGYKMPKQPFDFTSFANANAAVPGEALKGLKKLKAEKTAMIKAKQAKLTTDAQLAASRSREEPTRVDYARPEDMVNTGEEFFPVYGVGTNALARDGKVINKVRGGNKTEIQNTYAPYTIYDQQGYEPLPRADFGSVMTGPIDKTLDSVTGQLYGNNAGADIGGSLGGAVGSIFGPAGRVVGKQVGKLAGWALDRRPAQTAKLKNAAMANVGMIGGQDMLQGIQSQNLGFMKDGGWISNDWQPQVIAKFGEYKVSDLLKDDPTMNTLRTGGHLRQNTGYPDFAMGGDLKVYRGEAEPISYNPHLPSDGQTVMFRGPSHEDGGIPIKYGANGVEVEGGEPAIEMRDGGKDQNLVVYGNLDASMLPDPKAKGMKFKNYINMLSKDERKNTGIVDKAMDNINRIGQPRDKFEDAEFNSWKLNAEGADSKNKTIADKKMTAASFQQAINDTAKDYDLDAEALAKGKVKQAKLGTSLRKAAGGDELEYINPADYERLTKMYDAAKAQGRGKAVEEFQREFSKIAPNRAKAVLGQYDVTSFGKKAGLQATDPASNIDQIFGKRTEAYRAAMDQGKQPIQIGPDYTVPEDTPRLTGISDLDLTNKPVATTPPKSKIDWFNMLSSTVPYLRPSDAQDIDTRQFAGELLALSQNQLEPVWAQKFQPQLTVPYDISYQDILNENIAATRAAQRMAGYNPAAQANIAAQQYAANQKVLGEQFRANQAMKNQVYAQNRQLVDAATLQNIQMLQDQAAKQAQARTATKETRQAAVQSIASKVLQNEARNKELKAYENLYNYRFGPDMIAQNWNPLAQFDTNIGTASQRATSNVPEGFEATYKKDDSGNYVIDAYKKKKTQAARNGSIVQSLKRI